MKRIFLAGFALLLSTGLSLSAEAQQREVIEAVKPARVYPGEAFDIIGRQFGGRQANNKTVMISATIADRAYRYKLRVVKWSDRRIRVDTDEIVVPASYSVGIYINDETGLVSNTMSLIVLGGMVIERISPNAAAPAETVEIHGRHFGRVQAGRIVSMNLNRRKHRMQVIAWSDGLIRARVPAGLEAGEYRLLIYYDDSLTSSSDSTAITVQHSR